jgi:hypothetical protein
MLKWLFILGLIVYAVTLSHRIDRLEFYCGMGASVVMAKPGMSTTVCAP